MIRLLVLLLALPALAQQLEPPAPPDAPPSLEPGGSFVINLRATELAVFAEQVSEITGRTLVLGPEVSGTITVVSSEPLDRPGVWALFQSVLRTRGFVAVQLGAAWQVVPETEARSRATTDAAPGSQDVVTRLVALRRLPAAEAVRVLRPLVADSGYIEAVNDPNGIIVTDTRDNAERIVNIARAFDGDEAVRSEVIRFEFADAATVGQAIADVLGEAGTGARLSVDPVANLLLVRGTDPDIADIRRLAAAMDIAPRPSPAISRATRVYRLQFGDAETVAELIAATLADGGDVTSAVAESLVEEGFTPLDARDAVVPPVSVEASTEVNAVIARGTPDQLAEVAELVAALDVRRAQVLIEAAIVEVSGTAAERLGVQLGFGDAAPPGGFAATSFANSGASLQGVLAALGNPAAATLTGGLTIGLSQRNTFGVLIQALASSNDANLLSTPSVTTLDNQPASIVVGQNVPFRTGEFATDGNTAEPFTTIERRDVGITLDVLPRITEAGVVRLAITQEVSSLVGIDVQGAADLVTNRRVIETTVLAEDGGTIVLGGLITDDRQSGVAKVPLLGDIPILGALFRSRTEDATRRTLFVFLRPTILRTQEEAQAASEARYRRLQAEDSRPPSSLLFEREVRKLPLEIQGLY